MSPASYTFSGSTEADHRVDAGWVSPVHSLGFWFQSQFPMSNSPSSPWEWGLSPGPETPAQHGVTGRRGLGLGRPGGAPASGFASLCPDCNRPDGQGVGGGGQRKSHRGASLSLLRGFLAYTSLENKRHSDSQPQSGCLPGS